MEYYIQLAGSGKREAVLGLTRKSILSKEVLSMMESKPDIYVLVDQLPQEPYQEGMVTKTFYNKKTGEFEFEFLPEPKEDVPPDMADILGKQMTQTMMENMTLKQQTMTLGKAVSQLQMELMQLKGGQING